MHLAKTILSLAVELPGFELVPVPLEYIPASHWLHVAELVAAVKIKRVNLKMIIVPDSMPVNIL